MACDRNLHSTFDGFCSRTIKCCAVEEGYRSSSENFSMPALLTAAEIMKTHPHRPRSESRFLGRRGGYRSCSDIFSRTLVKCIPVSRTTPSSSVGVPFTRRPGGYRSCSDTFPAAADIDWCRHLDLSAVVIITIDPTPSSFGRSPVPRRRGRPMSRDYNSSISRIICFNSACR